MSEAPQIVVVGAASRDLVDDDVRGWRLGGGVSYSALALARLGLRVGALVGVDGLAADADELDLLRDAGAEVQLVHLGRGPGVREPRDSRRVASRSRTRSPIRSRWRRCPTPGPAHRDGCSRRSRPRLPTPGPRCRRVTRSWPSAGRGCCGCSSRAGRSRGSSRPRRRSSGVPTSSEWGRTTSIQRHAARAPGLVRRPRRHAARHRWRPRRHSDRDGARRVVAGPTPGGPRSRRRGWWTRPAPATRSSPRCLPHVSTRRSSAAARATASISGSVRPPPRSCASGRGCSGVPSLAAVLERLDDAAGDRRLGLVAPAVASGSRAAAGAPRDGGRGDRGPPRAAGAGGRSSGPAPAAPRRPGRGEGALGVAEAVLAQLRDLDPGDRAERAAGRRRGLPRLGRLRPAPEPPQHAGPLRGNPLVRPARAGVP